MSERVLRINELIRQQVNNLLLTEIEFPKGCLVTIVKVETSKDLRHSKVFVSILPFKYTAKVYDKLNKNVGHLQYLLNRKLRMRPLPRLHFRIDTTEKQASDIEQLLDSLKKSS